MHSINDAPQPYGLNSTLSNNVIRLRVPLDFHLNYIIPYYISRHSGFAWQCLTWQTSKLTNN